ncbi:MAG: TetR/AcrR family transcriptional regulator [Actinomycetes bacterium]
MAYTVKSHAGGVMGDDARVTRGARVAGGARRASLTSDVVVREAIALADAHGLDALSMRSLADRLGVVPMALYKHVRDKDALLDHMVDAILAEIPAAAPTGSPARWHDAVRERILGTRAALHRHPWAWRALETRTAPSPAMLDHLESVIAILREGGLDASLTHHAMHALGSRVWGFTQELAPSPPPPADPAVRSAMLEAMASRWPRVLESAMAARHDPGTAVGPSCDDDAEFAFAIDVLLDGIALRHAAGWSAPPAASPGATPA